MRMLGGLSPRKKRDTVVCGTPVSCAIWGWLAPVARSRCRNASSMPDACVSLSIFCLSDTAKAVGKTILGWHSIAINGLYVETNNHTRLSDDDNLMWL